jgi:hypothetical protein
MAPALIIETHVKALYCPTYLWSVHIDKVTTVCELWGSDGPPPFCQASKHFRNDSLISMLGFASRATYRS